MPLKKRKESSKPISSSNEAVNLGVSANPSLSISGDLSASTSITPSISISITNVPNQANLCANCSKEVSSGAIKACDKIWHKDCFVCATCHKPFDKNGYTNVDGKPYCKKDLSEAKKNSSSQSQGVSLCPTCNKEVTGPPVMAVMNKKFHEKCFKCASCKKKLKDKPFFESAEGLPLCKKCIKKKK